MNLGQLVNGTVYQHGVTYNIGNQGPDPREMSDAEITAELKRNAKLRERFRLLAALPTAGRAAMVLALFWGAQDPLNAAMQDPGNTFEVVGILAFVAAAPWVMFRTQFKDWRDEQLAVIALLKQRRAPLLIERARRRLQAGPSLMSLLQRFRGPRA